MAGLKWLPGAISDIKRLHSFLASKDTEAASRAAQCILDGANILKSNPRIGRPMQDETGRRELFTAFGAGAYVLRYMVEDDKTVVIIRIWHSREYRI